MNLPNHLRVMMIKNIKSKFEIIWLQMKKQSKDYRVERFGKVRRCCKSEQNPPRKMVEELYVFPTRRRMEFLNGPLNLCEALRSENASKWETSMQEEYDFLIANGT